MTTPLTDATGQGITLNLNGRDYRLNPLTLDDLASFHGVIKSKRLKLFLDTMRNGERDADFMAKATAEILSKEVSDEEFSQEMAKLDGTRFMLFCCIRQFHPEMTLEKTSPLIDNANWGEVLDTINSISGWGTGTESKNGGGAEASQ